MPASVAPARQVKVEMWDYDRLSTTNDLMGTFILPAAWAKLGSTAEHTVRLISALPPQPGGELSFRLRCRRTYTRPADTRIGKSFEAPSNDEAEGAAAQQQQQQQQRAGAGGKSKGGAAAAAATKHVCVVNVLRASGLPIADKKTKSADPFCEVIQPRRAPLAPTKFRTKRKKRTREPVWNQQFQFEFGSLEELHDAQMEVRRPC